MSEVLISRSNMTNIANAIRAKSGTTIGYAPNDMAAAITAIPGGAYDWMGSNVTCLNDNYYSLTYYLSSSTYSSWSASTTAKSLRATASITNFTATDLAQYSYLIRWIVTTHVAHKQTATLTAIPVLQINVFDQQIMRRPSSLANIQAKNDDANVYTNAAALGWMQYYSSSSKLTYTWSSSNGFYAAVPTPALSSTTVASPTITPKTPILYTKCSTSYFDTARYGDIDIDNTYWTIKMQLYRMDAQSCMRQRYDDLIDLIDSEFFPTT